MRIIGNKILVRITKENRETIYSKEITRNDGSKVRLFKAIPADESEARHSELFVQTAIVEGVGDNIKDIFVGDIALLNYDLCNAKAAFAYRDGEDEIFWLDAITTYHKEDIIVGGDRKGSRLQKVQVKGDYDEMSPLLGIIRGLQLIGRDPYVFLNHKSNVEEKKTATGIVYNQKNKIYIREVLACSEISTKKFGIEKGDQVMVDDYDVFNVKITEDYSIDCVNDIDVLMKK